MRMSVIPEQARGMIARNLDRVAQNLARHGHHIQDVVLGSMRRNSQAVKVQIRHVHTRSNRATFRWLSRKIVDVGDLQLISRRQPQGWSLWLAVKVEGVLSIACDASMQSQGKRVVFCAKLRGSSRVRPLAARHRQST